MTWDHRMGQDGKDHSGSSDPTSLPRQGYPKSECYPCVNQSFTAGGLTLQKHGAENDPTAKLTILSLMRFLCSCFTKTRGDLHTGMVTHQEFIQAMVHLIRKKNQTKTTQNPRNINTKNQPNQQTKKQAPQTN